jgi:hypothetical protein
MTWNGRSALGWPDERVNRQRGEVEPKRRLLQRGQKLYFWSIVVSAIVFLVSGIRCGSRIWPLGCRGELHLARPRRARHGGRAIVHLYEATAAQPGTFKSMIRGTWTPLGVDASSRLGPGRDWTGPAGGLRAGASRPSHRRLPCAMVSSIGLLFGWSASGPSTISFL